MREVHDIGAASLTADQHGEHAEEDGRQRQPGRLKCLIREDIRRDYAGFDKQDRRHEQAMPTGVRIVPVMAKLQQILHPDIGQDQRPRDVILLVIRLPVGPRPLRDKIHQEHIYKQEYMFPDTVPAVDIDIVCGEIPDLDHRERRHDIGEYRR